jgi:MFS family permease
MNLTEVQKRAKFAVTLTFVTNGLVVGAFVARIPDIKAGLQISNSVLSLCLLAGSFGVFTALSFAGKLCAKFGSSPVAIWASFAMAMAYLLQGFSTLNAWPFALGSFVAGYSLATQDVAMNTHAVTLEHQCKSRLMSVFHAMFSIGGFTGGVIGGVFAQLDISYAIQSIFITATVLAIALSVRNLWLPADHDRHDFAKAEKGKVPRIFWIFGIFGLCAAIGEGAAGDWGGVLTRENFEATPFVSAIPFVAFSATMILGRFSGDYLATKFGAMKVLATGGLIASLGMTTGLLINSITGVIFGWFWLGAGLSVAIPLLFSAVGTLANQRFKSEIAPAQAVAMVSGISYSGFIFGPPLIGFISDATSLRTALFLPAILAIAIVASSRLVKSQ